MFSICPKYCDKSPLYNFLERGIFSSISKVSLYQEIITSFFLSFIHCGDMTGTPPGPVGGPPGGVEPGQVVVLSSAVLLKKLCCKA